MLIINKDLLEKSHTHLLQSRKTNSGLTVRSSNLLLQFLRNIKPEMDSSCLQMFSATTKAFVKSLGAQGDLIYNDNVNEKIEMLTLVKVRKKTFWPVIRYSIIDQTLLDLLEEEITPGIHTDQVQTLRTPFTKQ